MRPPVCEICDADVDPAGGLVTFQPDDRSRDWRRRAEEEGFVGHPPDTGWFCEEHIAAAREAAQTMSYGPGVRHVEARARAIDVRLLDLGDPDGLSAPMPIPPRSGERAREELRRARTDLGRLRTQTSHGYPLGDISRTIEHHLAGDLDLFTRVDRPMSATDEELIETRVVRRGELLALVRVTPSAGAGARIDRVQVWVGDESMQPWIDRVVAVLSSTPPHFLDPAPDLIDVDLGRGRLAASDALEVQWVEWDLTPVGVRRVVGEIRDRLGDLCRSVGAGEPPELADRTERSWTPMDGAKPPHCPFSDTATAEGSDGDISVQLRQELVHWNETDVDSAGMRCSISRGDETLLSVSAYGEHGEGRNVSVLRLRRPTNEAVVRIVDDLVARLARS